MKNIPSIISLFIIGIVFFSSCSKKAETTTIPKSNEAIPVKIVALNKSLVKSSIHASGQFTTDDETLLSFKTGGIINNVYVKEGDKVRKGQLLATLDLTEISAQVNQAQIAVNKAKRDNQRAENLYKDSVATLEQLQNSKSALEISQQQLAAAKFNLSYSEIRATNDGVILKRIANAGQIVGSGMPVLQTSSKGSKDWILRVAVSDKEWAQCSINDKAKINIEAFNLNNIDGFIYAKSENADPMTGSFNIDIKLNNTRKFNIASGMFGKAEIMNSHKTNVWQIPYDALLDGNANSGFVFVTRNNKNALKVPVKISSIDRDYVLISEGLNGYNSLIVSGSAYLTDGSTIQVVNN